MSKQIHSSRPFSLVVIFIIIIIGIYAIGRGVLNNKSKDNYAKIETDVGFVAPDFVIKDVYGLEVPLSKVYQARPVFLIFWSSWCPYCAQELPNLLTFGNTYQDYIQVVLVMSGESKQTIETYRSNKNIPFVTALDTSREIWQLYNVLGTPHHFVINTQGKIIENRPGILSLSMLENIAINVR